MFNTLIESRRTRKRGVGSTVFSAAFHATIILLAVYATASARMADEPAQRAENLKFIEVKPEEPKPEPEPPTPKPPPPRPKQPEPRQPQPAPAVEAPAPPRGFQTLQAPVTIPVRIPEVNLSAPVVTEADFSGRGVAGGTAGGQPGGTPGGTGTAVAADLGRQVFREHEVERAVSVVNMPAPNYPPTLREDGIEGRVVLEFIVDANGRVDMNSIKVIESSNNLFTAAVRSALSRARFSPARVGGQAVRQYVQQPFSFKLDRGE